MSRIRLIKNLPPLIGLVLMIVLGFVMRRYFLLAIPFGLVAWWASHALLFKIWGDQDLLSRRRQISQIPDARSRQDMSQALARVERLKFLNTQIPDTAITAALDELANQAAFLIDESISNPLRANVAHKALALYLEDAVDVSQGFADLQRFKAMPQAEIEKTVTSLEHLIALFQTYAERMRHAESLDLDIKITVLEERLRGEGVFDR